MVLVLTADGLRGAEGLGHGCVHLDHVLLLESLGAQDDSSLDPVFERLAYLGVHHVDDVPTGRKKG